ncbi:MAG TPA: heavy-metal-associated domain-containing protein [Rubrivivax sp.]|nr:heavy-metal-associated domain-containing protein [Rubrivivax sp.]
MIELTLPDMTCGHCVKTVTAVVQRVDAAAKLQIDLPTHQLRIESALPAADFERALSEEGYAPG